MWHIPKNTKHGVSNVIIYSCRVPGLSGKEHLVLEEPWQLDLRFYEGSVAGSVIHGSACDLRKQDGVVCYHWKNIHSDREFYRMIHHANGHDYLLFRRDLYGYSVLDLCTMQDFHYMPEKAFPEKQKDFEETFIWTDVSYHPKHNLLAVSGCFWACPSSVIILDFSMLASENWIDLHQQIDASYNVYDDMQFIKWEEDGSLVLKALHDQGSR